MLMHTYIRGGDPKITGIIFLKWFIRFYTITILASFRVLSFWIDTHVPPFLPLLETFLELFSADVVQDLQCFLFHFTDISRTFPFHLAFCMREEEKVAWHKVGWIGRMRDNRHVALPTTAAHSRPCGQGHCHGEGTYHCCSTFLVVSYSNLPLTFADMNSKTNQLSQKSRHWSKTICIDCVANFFKIFIISAGWRSARSWLVLTWHFTPFETWLPLVHLSLT